MPRGRQPPKPGVYRWIVDPLDGTTNYVHRLPHYAVSLALERDGQAVGRRGLRSRAATSASPPAWAAGRISTAGRSALAALPGLPNALAVCGFPPHVKPDSPDLRVFQKAIFRSQAVRRSGCSSLNLCYLAAGRYDVYWSFGTKIWDVAAGTLIVREAGGIVTAPDGGPFILDSAQFLAAPRRPCTKNCGHSWRRHWRDPFGVRRSIAAFRAGSAVADWARNLAGVRKSAGDPHGDHWFLTGGRCLVGLPQFGAPSWDPATVRRQRNDRMSSGRASCGCFHPLRG